MNISIFTGVYTQTQPGGDRDAYVVSLIDTDSQIITNGCDGQHQRAKQAPENIYVRVLFLFRLIVYAHWYTGWAHRFSSFFGPLLKRAYEVRKGSIFKVKGGGKPFRVKKSTRYQLQVGNDLTM